MAMMVDPDFPSDYVRSTPRMGVALVYPSTQEQASLVVPKPNPLFQPVPPSPGAADLAAAVARAEAVSHAQSIFSASAPAQPADAQPARPSDWSGPAQPDVMQTRPLALGLPFQELPPEPNRPGVVSVC